MKYIILGTAGHIDHGKTTLIKALTGVDCDRLKEEKARGITIELGFTYLDLAEDVRIGIVDVPGHERFIHHMVAGVVGMDLVLLVVAADEGIMPQTREHLDICRLLGVKKGLVTITKIDLVDSEWLDLVTDEIKGFVQGTFLGQAPVIPVSSTTGKGLDSLIKVLGELAKTIPEHISEGTFRLPVDRVFTMKGFGTVVTGTLLSGKVRIGEMVEIFPQQIQARIRGIQVHNEKVEYASAGQRTAINLQGLDKEVVNRGNVISRPDFLVPGYLLDARLTLLESVSGLKNRTRIRFYTGTAEVFGRIVLLDRENLDPGSTCFVQFRLEEKLAVMPYDRYIIRRYSPITTLGGGQIIDSHPAKHKRYKQDVLDDLSLLEHSSIPQFLEFYIRKASVAGIDLNALMARTNLEPVAITGTLEILHQEGKILILDGAGYKVVHKSIYKEVQKKIMDILKGFHEINRLKWGISKEELKARVSPEIDPRFYNMLLEDMEKSGSILLQKETCALASHKVSISSEDQNICEDILRIFKQAGPRPPSQEDIFGRLGKDHKRLEKLIGFLIDGGKLTRLKGGLLFHKDALDKITFQVRGYLEDGKQMGIGDFKDLTGLSRKFAVPLLEYLDAQGITIRVGDTRILRKKGSEKAPAL